VYVRGCINICRKNSQKGYQVANSRKPPFIARPAMVAADPAVAVVGVLPVVVPGTIIAAPFVVYTKRFAHL
jgi:hypothetical protein